MGDVNRLKGRGGRQLSRSFRSPPGGSLEGQDRTQRPALGKKIGGSPTAQGVSKLGEFTALSQNTCRRGEVQKSCVHSKLMPYKRTMVHTNFIVQNSNLEIVMMSTPLRVDDFSVWIHGRKRRKMGRWEKRIGSLHAEWFHDHDHWMEVCLSILIPIGHFRTELSVHCQQNSSSTVKDIAASRCKVNTSFYYTYGIIHGLDIRL